MKTPKEKAIELVRQFYSIGANECKQCALIAIEEAMQVAIELDYEYGYRIEYWQEVKTEIEKL